MVRARIAAVAAAAAVLAGACSVGSSNPEQDPAPVHTTVARQASETTEPEPADQLSDLYRSYGGPLTAPSEDCMWARPDEGWRCWVIELPETRASDNRAAWTWALMRPPLSGSGPTGGVMYVDLGQKPGHDDLASLPEWVAAKGDWLDSWYVFSVLTPGLNPGRVPLDYSSERGLTEASQYPSCPDGAIREHLEDVVWTDDNDGYGKAAVRQRGLLETASPPDLGSWPGTELPTEFRWDGLADTADNWTRIADDCSGFNWRAAGPDYHSDLIELARRTLVGENLPVTAVFERSGTATAAALVRKHPTSVSRLILIHPDLGWGTRDREGAIDAAVDGWTGWTGPDGAERTGFAEWCIDQDARCYDGLSRIDDLPEGLSASPASEDYLALWTTTVMLRRYPHKASAARVLINALPDPARWPELARAMVSVPTAWPDGGYPARPDDPDGDGFDDLGRPVPRIPRYDHQAQSSEGGLLEALGVSYGDPGPAYSPSGAGERSVAGWAHDCNGGQIPRGWDVALVGPGSRPRGAGALASSLSAWAVMSSPAAGAALEAFSSDLFGEWVSDQGIVRSGGEMCDRLIGVFDPLEPEPVGENAWEGDFPVMMILTTGRPDLYDPVSDPAARALLDRAGPNLVTMPDPGGGPWHTEPELCIDAAVRDFLASGALTAPAQC